MVFHWGMAGAALATIIGQIISAIIVIRYLLHFKTVSLTKEHFRPQIEYISKTAQIGMASFFNQVAMMVVQIIMNNSLTHYGAASVYGDAIPLACAGTFLSNLLILYLVRCLTANYIHIFYINWKAGKGNLFISYETNHFLYSAAFNSAAFYGNRRMYLLWTDCRLFSSSCYNYHGIS